MGSSSKASSCRSEEVAATSAGHIPHSTKKKKNEEEEERSHSHRRQIRRPLDFASRSLVFLLQIRLQFPLPDRNPRFGFVSDSEMLRLRAFRPSGDKIVKIQLHPTHPWLVTADASDFVSVWNWEHRQVVAVQLRVSPSCFALCDAMVIYELKAGRVDERCLVGA
ncbi:hypothetical protein NL676_030404 [Syzygium grande]|nr:hypothetical protein NL676_030404 [Syzygium grande]